MSIDAYIAPETLQGPYSEFYRRAMAELLCWRLVRDGSDQMTEFAAESVDSDAFDAIGIQMGRA